jgi:hypothetical protein
MADDDVSKLPPRISRLVTAGAVALAAIHVVFPDVKIDNITLGLLAIAVVPWLAPIFKSVVLPGGLKVEFQVLTQKVEQELRDNRNQVQNIAQRVEELAQFAIGGAAPATLKDRLAADLTSYRAYLIGLGIDLSGNPPSVSIADGEYDNAHYDGAKNEIVAGRNFAWSDVLFREYTHHALGLVRGQVGLTGERQDAVESALADYFPCSYRNEPLLGREVASYLSRTQGFEKAAIRNLETPARLTDVPNRQIVQAAGEIWAAAFWEIRKRIGQQTADRLLLQAWKDSPSGAKAEAAFVKTLQDLVDAPHRAAVADAFVRRKLA